MELWDAAAIPAPTTDFWGVALPAWVGAIGSIAASTVATIALVREVRTRGGLKQATAPEPEGSPQIPSDREALPTAAPRAEAGGAEDADVTDSPQVTFQRAALRVARINRKMVGLVNTLSTEIVIYEVRQADDGQDLHVPPLPHLLQPSEGLTVSIERSLASPSLIAVDVTYGSHDWSRRQRLYID